MKVDRLLHEHAKLRSLAADLLALVAVPEPCALDELAHRRWELARTIHMHLAYEERQLFAPLATDPRSDVRTAAAMAKRSVELLHAAYKAHVERWSSDEVVSRWPEFQGAVRALIIRMIGCIDREEALLFPSIAEHDEPERRWQLGMRNWAGEGVALQRFISGGGELGQPDSAVTGVTRSRQTAT